METTNGRARHSIYLTLIIHLLVAAGDIVGLFRKLASSSYMSVKHTTRQVGNLQDFLLVERRTNSSWLITILRAEYFKAMFMVVVTGKGGLPRCLDKLSVSFSSGIFVIKRTRAVKITYVILRLRYFHYTWCNAHLFHRISIMKPRISYCLELFKWNFCKKLFTYYIFIKKMATRRLHDTSGAANFKMKR